MPFPHSVVDDTQKNVTVEKDPPVKDPVVKDPDPNLSTKDATNELDVFLKTHNFDSLGDLTEALESSAKMRDALQGHDIEDLLQNAGQMKRYEAYWAEQKESQLRESEEPEETIKRLENKLKEKSDKETEFESRRKESEEAEQVITTFNNVTSSLVDDDTDIPDTHKSLLKLLCGVNNIMNEIDIRKKPDIKRMKKEHLKVINKFAEQILAAAVKKGDKIPPMSPSIAPPAGDDEPVKAKSITESGKLALPIFAKILEGMKGKK